MRMSWLSLAVAALGENCVPGSYKSHSSSDHRLICLDCPAGTFGNRFGLNSSECSGFCIQGHFGSLTGMKTAKCQGLCEEGYFCGEGSKSARESSCGGATWFCTSGIRFPVSDGYYSTGGNITTRTGEAKCEPGFYCVHGLRYPCQAGRFQPDEGFAVCDTICPEGYFCPIGSVKPVKCPAGTYGEMKGLASSECSGKCSPGYYCDKHTINISPQQSPCPQGIVGKDFGMISSACTSKCDTTSSYCASESSICRPGYYCPANSSVETECGDISLFCPRGSYQPTDVSDGYYSYGGNSPTTQTKQVICEKGHYCIAGEKFKCPSGSYGSSAGLADASCSGECAAGFYCPEASTSLHEMLCGDISQFCPLGSTQSQTVQLGYYTIGTSPYMRDSEQLCEKGNYCDGTGMRRPCNAGTYGPTDGLIECDLLCPPGFYCPEQSTQPVPCPAGRYGDVSGLQDANCSGPAREGYFTRSGSKSPSEYICNSESPGAKQQAGVPIGMEAGVYYGDINGEYDVVAMDQVFCPPGTDAPIVVSDGFYAAGGTGEGSRAYQVAS